MTSFACSEQSARELRDLILEVFASYGTCCTAGEVTTFRFHDTDIGLMAVLETSETIKDTKERRRVLNKSVNCGGMVSVSDPKGVVFLAVWGEAVPVHASKIIPGRWQLRLRDLIET